MMLRFLGGVKRRDCDPGDGGAIRARTVTYDFHRLMDYGTLVKCSSSPTP